MTDVTQLLEAIERGETGANERLWPVVYGELRRLASAHLVHEKPGLTLDATALVHEAYLRLAGPDVFENRRHFFGAASQAMRRILVESARHKARERHGGGRNRERVEWHDPADVKTDEDLLDLHEALELLAGHDAAVAKLVELRFFGGLTLEQAAECLNLSLSTANRNWRYARAWLYSAMADAPSDEIPLNP